MRTANRLGLFLLGTVLAAASFLISAKSVLADDDADTEPLPVLFVHGFNDDGSSWEKSDFYDWVSGLGVEVTSLDYGDYSRNDVTSDTLQERMEDAFDNMPDDSQFDIVSHGMGGQYVRHFLNEHPDYHDKVRRVTMIGTPNKGSPTALGVRVTSLLNESEKLMTNEEQERVSEYEDYYEEFSEDRFEEFDNEKADESSFESWLWENHPDEMEKFSDWQHETAASDIESPNEALETSEDYRYSKAFSEYMALLAGVNNVREEMDDHFFEESIPMDNDNPFMDDETYEPHEVVEDDGEIDPSSDDDDFDDWMNGKNNTTTEQEEVSTYNIAFDRLMSETFHMVKGIADDGRMTRDSIVANPFLYELNEEERSYRHEAEKEGEYIPQYVTIGTSSDSIDSFFVKSFYKQWSLAGNTTHDLVTPLGNAGLPAFYLDRNATSSSDDIKHTEQMEATDLLKEQYGNPITGERDRNVYEELREDTEEEFSVGNNVVLTPEEDDENEDYDVTIEAKEDTHVYIVERNSDEEWESIEKKELTRGKSFMYLTEETLEFSDDNDYLLIGDASLTVHTDADEEVSSEQPYYIEPLETDYEENRVTHTFRVFNRFTDKPVNGLSERDFKLWLDNDWSNMFTVEQETEEISGEDHVVLELDHSGSMRDSNGLYESRKQAEEYIKLLQEEDKNVTLGVIGFSDEIETFTEFTRDYEEAYHNLYHDLSGSTAIYDTVIEGVEMLEDTDGNRSIILMTDGLDNESDASLDEAIEEAEQHDVTVHPIGLGSGVDFEVLEKLADETGGQVYGTEAAENLGNIYSDITQDSDYVYTLSYMTPHPYDIANAILSLSGDKSNEAELLPEDESDEDESDSNE